MSFFGLRKLDGLPSSLGNSFHHRLAEPQAIFELRASGSLLNGLTNAGVGVESIYRDITE
jgi:hypothetical protein